MKAKALAGILLAAALLISGGCSSMSTAAGIEGGADVSTDSAIDTGEETDEADEAEEDADDEEEEVEVKDTRKKIKLDKTVLKSAFSYEDGRIALEWGKVKKADVYEVYRSAEKKGTYEKLKTTKKTRFVDKSGKAYTTYYYKVRAIAKENKAHLSSSGTCSKTVSKVCRKAPARSAYLGDSVMSGFGIYGVLKGGEKSFAERSLRVTGLYNSILPNVINYRPDRVYIMIGTNETVGNPSESLIKTRIEKYDDVIEKLKKNNPNVEIICMGIGPTRNCSRITNATVERYNKVIKSLASKYDYAFYYDTTKVLKDSGGSLKSSYAARDGIHWSVAAYKAVYADLKEFVKKM